MNILVSTYEQDKIVWNPAKKAIFTVNGTGTGKDWDNKLQLMGTSRNAALFRHAAKHSGELLAGLDRFFCKEKGTNVNAKRPFSGNKPVHDP
jgi:hypothetical protein